MSAAQSSFFDRDQFLGEIFPQNRYREIQRAPQGDPRKQQVAGTYIQHMLVADLSIATISRHIDQHSSWTNALNENFYSLSPLHVAVIKGNRQAVELLIKREADVSQKDHRGWTPLHHAAALGEDSILSLLIDKVGAQAAKRFLNNTQGCYEDIQRLVAPVLPQPEDNVCLFHDGTTLSPCSARKFQRLTGATYFDGIYADLSSLYMLWKDGGHLAEFNNWTPSERLVAAFKNFRQTPPELYFGKQSERAPQGFDVFTNQNHTPGEVVATYGGSLSVEEPRNRYQDVVYKSGDIDGMRYRNLAPMVNNGFPNIINTGMFVDGLFQEVFLTTRRINNNERLFFDYGFGNRIGCLFPYLELNSQDLLRFVEEKFIRKNPIHTFLISYGPSSNREKAEFAYLLGSPSSWIYLISQGQGLKFLKDIELSLSALESGMNTRGPEIDLDQIEYRRIFIHWFRWLSKNFLKPQIAEDTQALFRRKLGEWVEKYALVVLVEAVITFCNRCRFGEGNLLSSPTFALTIFESLIKFINPIFLLAAKAQPLNEDEILQIKRDVEEYARVDDRKYVLEYLSKHPSKHDWESDQNKRTVLELLQTL